MTKRLTPEEIMDREMEKLKAMGITISTRPAPGNRAGFENRPMGIIAEAAKRHGISEDDTEGKAS